MFYFPLNPLNNQIVTTPLGQNFMWVSADDGWRSVKVAQYSDNPLTVSLFTLNTPVNLPLGGGNGVEPYTFQISSGALPIGILLNSATGMLTGAATGAGAYSFTVTVTDSMGGTGRATFSGIISE